MKVESSTSAASQTQAQGTMGAGMAPTKDEFLKLFVAQLEHQDPLSPTENSEFVAQLAQFASLEQAANMNTQLQSLEAQQATATGTALAGMVGRTITAAASRVHVSEDAAAPPPLVVKLDKPANDVKVVVRDADGNVVRTIDLGPSRGGTVPVGWDGRGPDGRLLPEGDYSIEASATDVAGGVLPATAMLIGPLEAVDFWGGVPHLRFGSFSVTPGDVVTIGQ